jgi:hypothetical protein
VHERVSGGTEDSEVTEPSSLPAFLHDVPRDESDRDRGDLDVKTQVEWARQPPHAAIFLWKRFLVLAKSIVST